MEEFGYYIYYLRLTAFILLGCLGLLFIFSPKFKSWIEEKELYWVFVEIQEKKKKLILEVPMNYWEKVLLYGGAILFISGILKFLFVFFVPSLTIPVWVDLTLDKGASLLGYSFTRISAWSLSTRRSNHENKNQKRSVFNGPKWKRVINALTSQNVTKVVTGAAGLITVTAATGLLAENPLVMIVVGQPYRLIAQEISTKEFTESFKSPFEYTQDLKESREQMKIARGAAIQRDPVLFYSPEGGNKTPEVAAIKKGLTTKYTSR